MTTAQATTQKGTLFSALHALTDEITTEKQAASRSKQADSPVPGDPGGYQGSSTHPTTAIDNRGQDAGEGARSSENVSDVKSDQGSPGVDSTSEASTSDVQDSVQLNIGTQQSATGEDPSTEDDYKAGKDDPGSSHPAKTDNSGLDGHKYANATSGQLRGLSETLANGILADLANGQGGTLTKQALDEAQAASECNLNPAAAGTATPAAPKQQQAGEVPAGEKTAAAGSLSGAIEKAAAAVKAGNVAAGESAQMNPDLAAGYELAAHLGVEKTAAQEAVATCLQETISDAQTDADLFGSFYGAYQQKAAMDGADPAEGEDHGAPGDETSGAGEAEGAGGPPAGPEGGGAPGGGGGLGDLLGGGEDPGGLMGADPGMGGGDPMGGDPMGGGGGEEEALMQLVAALDELGIPIEELAQAGGGGEMGGDPMGGAPAGPDGGMPMGMEGGAPAGPPMGDPMAGGGGDPMAAMGGGGDPMAAMAGGGGPPMGEGMKLASAAKAFKRSGKYQFKEAAAGTSARQLRDQMKGHLLELLSHNG